MRKKGIPYVLRITHHPMSLNRREFLKIAGLIAAGATVSACAPVLNEIAGSSPLVAPDNRHFRALSRMTFGPTVAERVLSAEIGLTNWIEQQLDYENIDDGGTWLRLRPYDVIRHDADALALWERYDVVDPFKQATLLRRIYSERQLYEVMVAFWTDHFNISINKGDCYFLKVVDDREVIRPYALGNFRDLLHASAKSPAMLIYLDNQANVKEHPNENYAREVMELHTLGVDGGYTQQDVMELARCFTGWTIKDTFWRGEFTFNADMHDNDPKVILGQSVTATGIGEAEEVLDRLATHPTTARFLATKLVRRFVTDNPERDAPALVAKSAETFLNTNGDIRSILRVILLDGVANNSSLPSKFKRPEEFVTSALRMTNASTDGHKRLNSVLDTMGQSLFEWPTPDGPADVATVWMHNLLPRWKLAMALARNEIDGTKLPVEDWVGISAEDDNLLNHFSNILLGNPYPDPSLFNTLHDVPADQLPQLIVAGLVASPAFQWR